MKKVNPKELASAVAPFETTEPGPGLFKLFTHIVMLGTVLWFTWSNNDNNLIFWTGTVIFSLLYPAMLITTHDALHHTYTGIKWIDELFPRVISYPLFWFHGVYQQVHKLHHKMNGSDLRDPERIQWTQREYEGLGTFGRFTADNQWLLSLFLYSGLGLIIKTLYRAARFYKKSKSMRKAFITDTICIIAFNVTLYTYLAHEGLALKYFLFWFLTQYIAGMVLQYRAFLEHYGLWGKGDHFYDTQVRNCRNIKTNAFGEWYFNGLCHHTIHHAFLKVPFYKLKDAQDAMSKVYEAHGYSQIPYEQGYIKTALKHIGRTRVITEEPKGGLEGTTPV